MTRGLIGIALALLGLLPLGTGVLFLTRTPFRVGLAIFAGVGSALVLLPPLVYAGLAPSVRLVLALGVASLIAGVLVGRPSRARSSFEPLPTIVLALPLVLLAARGAEKPVDQYDAFANWTLKAKLLYFDRSFADASIAPPVHREYPLGLPSLEAYVLHCIGSANARVLHVLFAVFLGGLALVVWNVLRPHVGAVPLTAGLSLLLWMPAARDQALSGYADLPLASLFVSAVFLLGSEKLALGSVFAAAALATKRDAVAFCAVLYALAFVASVVRRKSVRVRGFLVAVCAVALSALPWRMFDAVHGLHDNDIAVSSSNAGDVPFVIDRFAHLFVERAYLWAVPLAVGAAIVLLVRRRDAQLALGVLGLGLGLLAALVVVYLSGTTGVRYLVRSTADRTLMTPTLLAASVLPLLVTRALAVERRAAPARPRQRLARARGRTPRRGRRSRRAARRRR